MKNKYKKFLRKYSLTDKQVGEMFGYSSPVSWATASRRPQVMAGIVFVFETVEQNMRDRLNT